MFSPPEIYKMNSTLSQWSLMQTLVGTNSVRNINTILQPVNLGNWQSDSRAIQQNILSERRFDVSRGCYILRRVILFLEKEIRRTYESPELRQSISRSKYSKPCCSDLFTYRSVIRHHRYKCEINPAIVLAKEEHSRPEPKNRGSSVHGSVLALGSQAHSVHLVRHGTYTLFRISRDVVRSSIRMQGLRY